jgi:hypothetical protein
MDLLVLTILLIVVSFVLEYAVNEYYISDCNKLNKISEKFGALQSLYSNDGIQDTNLTIPNDRGYYDPYKYWRGVAWNLPTRNLDRLVFYPYLYEYNVDRYARLYPYW